MGSLGGWEVGKKGTHLKSHHDTDVKTEESQTCLCLGNISFVFDNFMLGKREFYVFYPR